MSEKFIQKSEKSNHIKIFDVNIDFPENTDAEIIAQLQKIQTDSLQSYLKEVEKYNFYPSLVARDGYGKLIDITMQHVEGGYSETNILDIPLAYVGYAGHNYDGYALINGNGTESSDYGGFSETGETVAEKQPDGQYAHFIVTQQNQWTNWYPENREIERERKRIADKKQ